MGEHPIESPDMNDVERLRLEREQLRAQYPDLFERLLQILFRVDPLGVNFEDNTNEYEPEVGTILPRLAQARSEADMHRILTEELEHWFGASIATRFPERVARAAREIWSARVTLQVTPRAAGFGRAPETSRIDRRVATLTGPWTIAPAGSAKVTGSSASAMTRMASTFATPVVGYALPDVCPGSAAKVGFSDWVVRVAS